MFVCYHADCGVRLSVPRYDDSWLGHRFQFQVNQAVDNTKASYGRWMAKEIADLQQYAYQMLVEYDQSGQLDNWESDVSLDPDQLDRYVLRALNCDLGNWAARLVRSKRNDNALVEDEKLKAREYGRTRKGDETSKAGDEWRNAIRAREESVEDIVMWLSWPTLGLKFRQGLTDKEIAKVLGVSVSTVRRRMGEEMADVEKNTRSISSAACFRRLAASLSTAPLTRFKASRRLRRAGSGLLATASADPS